MNAFTWVGIIGATLMVAGYAVLWRAGNLERLGLGAKRFVISSMVTGGIMVLGWAILYPFM